MSKDTQKKKAEEEKEPLWVTILDIITTPIDAIKAINDFLNLFKLIKWIFQAIGWVFRGIWKVITLPFD